MLNCNNPVESDGVVMDPRETMEILPFFLQHFLTWLTGKPLKGQKPLIKKNNMYHLLSAYIMLMGGIYLSIVSLMNGYELFLVVPWLCIVSGARKLIPTINHYCVHDCLLPKRWREKFGYLHPYIADFNSSILMLQPYLEYKIEHLNHHGIGIVASIYDPDMSFLHQLGFKAGMTKNGLLRVFLWNALFPFSKLHVLFFKSRIKSNWKGITLFRLIVQLITLAVLILIAWKTSFLLVFWAILFPLTYLYHIASLWQFLTEHLWLSDVNEDGTLDDLNHKEKRDRSKRITNARFCGEAVPRRQNFDFGIGFYVGWIVWWLKLFFVHLPYRLFVLSGTMITHDAHHRTAMNADWANSFYDRQDLELKLSESKFPLTEVWGIRRHLYAVFESLSKLSPLDPSKIIFEDETVLGM